MKFQDDISNMNTYKHTYIHTDKPKPICPLLFQSWGHKNYRKRRATPTKIFPKDAKDKERVKFTNFSSTNHKRDKYEWQ